MKPPGTNAGSGSISRLGPQFANRPPRIARPPNAPNSNRESLRLETAVTQRKQTLPISSNREIEALFSTAKTIRIIVSAERNRLDPRNLRRETGKQNSNRESSRLINSNREKEECVSPPMRVKSKILAAVEPKPRKKRTRDL